jgi:hypothetical protein
VNVQNSATWRRIEEVFLAAADLEDAQRGAYLDSACAGDPNIRAEVEALLVADADGRMEITSLIRGSVRSLGIVKK